MVQKITSLLTLLAAAASSVNSMAIQRRQGPVPPAAQPHFNLKIVDSEDSSLNNRYLTVNQFAVSSDADTDIRICGLTAPKILPSASENGNPDKAVFVYGWDQSHDDRSKSYLRYYDSRTIFMDDQNFNAGFKAGNGALYFARVSSVYNTWDDVTYAVDFGFTADNHLAVSGKDTWFVCSLNAPGEIKKGKQLIASGINLQVLSATKLNNNCKSAKVLREDVAVTDDDDN